MFYPEGVYSAMLTAFRPDGSLDEEVNRQLVEMQIEGGLDGIFPVSSSGESVAMDFASRCRLMDIVREQTAGRAAVLPGIPGCAPEEALALGRHARACGCDGVVLMPPYFYRPSSGSLTEYFLRIIRSEELRGFPVILYNIPLFAQPIPHEVIGLLAREANVAGLKDSSGSIVDFLNFMEEGERAGSAMRFLTGREEALLATLHMGGSGCFTATCAVLPEYMSAIYAAWKQGDSDRALLLQKRMVPFARAMMNALPFPSGFKLALEVRGYAMGAPRIPLGREELARKEEAADHLKNMMKELLDLL